MQQLYLSIGLMSGTSMDGIDAALLATDGDKQIKELASCSISYASPCKLLLKSLEFAVKNTAGDINQAAYNYTQLLERYLSEQLGLNFEESQQQLRLLQDYLQTELSFWAIVEHSTRLHIALSRQLLLKSGYKNSDITVIGYHGQALYHNPSQAISIQVGDAILMANELGIKVVNQFRRQDMLSGGRGAPLAPLYHQALACRDNKVPVAIVNCGGIANITIVTGCNHDEVLGFDTGPGNALIDRLIRQRTLGAENMDYNGKWGSQGLVQEDLLPLLYQEAVMQNKVNYFTQPPPKALDSYDLALLPCIEQLSLADAAATLAAFTADSIVSSLKWSTFIPSLWVLAGGGWYNPVIKREFIKRLQQQKKDVTVMTAEQANWDNSALEAQIFAYLAVRALQGKPLSLPNTTGVKAPTSGGVINYPMATVI